ncbi:MAG TPA: DoxX family protein [Stenotrophobium sp.]|jgi:uncharacterized membrane protein|nr:DoxX family protein [Stenotrophobium sp.]
MSGALARRLGLAFVFAWFLFGGIGHFAKTDFFVSIVPTYIPKPLAMVYISGIFELLGAVGVLIPSTRRLAGLGLFLLTLCVTPANVNMWLHPQQFPDMPEWAYSVRLVVQVLLLACIWWSTQPKVLKQENDHGG